MAKTVDCAGCGKKLKTGFFGDNCGEVKGKTYCAACIKNLPEYMTRECRECAYFYVDDNYDSFCKLHHNKMVDRNAEACTQYEKRPY